MPQPAVRGQMPQQDFLHQGELVSCTQEIQTQLTWLLLTTAWNHLMSLPRVHVLSMTTLERLTYHKIGHPTLILSAWMSLTLRNRFTWNNILPDNLEYGFRAWMHSELEWLLRENFAWPKINVAMVIIARLLQEVKVQASDEWLYRICMVPDWYWELGIV